jgi:poly(A) polymerase Pap1
MTTMTKFLGVTPPISTANSTPTEVTFTESLVQTLTDAGLFESDQEGMTR